MTSGSATWVSTCAHVLRVEEAEGLRSNSESPLEKSPYLSLNSNLLGHMYIHLHTSECDSTIYHNALILKAAYSISVCEISQEPRESTPDSPIDSETDSGQANAVSL